MESQQLARMIRDALAARGFERRGTRRHRRTDDLIWTVEAEKDRFGPRWNVDLGILLRGQHPGEEDPRADDGDIVVAIGDLPGPVPASAAALGFTDRGDYFRVAFDAGHAAVPDEERAAAAEYLADEAARLATSIRTVDDLAEWYAEGNLASAVIRKETRALLEGISKRDQ